MSFYRQYLRLSLTGLYSTHLPQLCWLFPERMASVIVPRNWAPWNQNTMGHVWFCCGIAEYHLNNLKSISCVHFFEDEEVQEKVFSRAGGTFDSQDSTLLDCKTLLKLKFRLQTHPRALAESLLDELPELECSLHGFTHSIYVVEIDGTLHYGLGIGSNMYLPGSKREALSKGCVSRASTKMEEALHVADLKLHQSMLVLDVGAAPGAWTEYLSRNVENVLAIDPGKLCTKAQKSNVSHICKKVEDAHKELQDWTRMRCFDLLVCDINKHPIETTRIIAPLLPYLKSGATIILTLKFHGCGKFKTSKINEIFSIFRDTLGEMECVWLMANSIYERTFIGKKL